MVASFRILFGEYWPKDVSVPAGKNRTFLLFGAGNSRTMANDYSGK